MSARTICLAVAVLALHACNDAPELPRPPDPKHMAAAAAAERERDARRLRELRVEASLRDVQVRVWEAAGAETADCGRFLRSRQSVVAPSQLRGALSCLLKSADHREPAQLLVHGQGEDSWGATGLLATTAGEVVSFVYDSDPSGGRRAGPRFSTERCPEPVVDDSDPQSATVACKGQ